MNKLTVEARGLPRIGGRFFGAPSLAIGSSPELDAFSGAIGAVEMGGTGIVDEVSAARVLDEVEGGSLGWSFVSISIASENGMAVFAFAAFIAAISSFGVL